MKPRLATVLFARAFVVLLSALSVVGCSSGSGKTPAATLVSIAVTPATPTIGVGGTQQFVATGTYSDKSTKNISSSVTWSSATTSTATVSTAGLATAGAAGTAVISAKSGTVSGSATLTVTAGTPPPVTLVSIAVTPATPSINVAGTEQFVATGSFSDGSTQDLSATATWASSMPTIATISTAGLATGVAKGTTAISATSAGISGSTTLTVTAPAALVSIAVTPTNPSIALGTMTQLTATGTFDDGTTKDLSATATWASATAATATVSTAGLVTGVAGGTSVITATSGTVMGTTTVTVTVAALMSIAVTPATPSIAAGTKQQFVATGTFKDPTTMATTTQDLSAMVTWSSATVATATITAAGLASGVAPGTSVITATSGTIMGTATLTVTMAPLMTIAVTPGTPSIARGTTQKFVATGTFADATTQDLSAQVAWTSATVATATIAATGIATSVAKGTTVITAKLGTIMGTATLTVTDAQLVSIAVTAVVFAMPTAPKIAKNTKVQLVATGTFTDSTTQDLTGSVAWASATGATAMVSGAAATAGLASGLAAGTSVITATVAATATTPKVVGMLTLTVTNETLVSIVVTPAARTIAAGTTQPFSATGFFTDASKQDLTETATWSSSTAAATVSNVPGTKGLASGAAMGTSVIMAAIGNINDTSMLTVTKALLVSLAITPPTPSIALKTTVPLAATGTFTDGTKQDLTTQVAWSSSMLAVAAVSSAAGSIGQVTGLTKGTSVITATYTIAAGQTVTTMVTVTVTDAALVSIAVSANKLTLEKGSMESFTATGTYTDATTQDLTKTVTWKTDKMAVATVSNVAATAGTVSAVGTGTAVISATSGAIVGMATLTVDDGKLVSIAVSAASPLTIAATTKLQLIATGTFDDGDKQVITGDVTWSSDMITVAKLSPLDGEDGLATGIAPGTAKITASETVGTAVITGTATLTVTNAQLVSIVVLPGPGSSSIAKGTTQQFTATGNFDDLSQQDLTDTVTWNTSMPTIANVSNDPISNGLATGLLVGMTNITATLGATTSAPIVLKVTAAVLTGLAITPAAPSVANGLIESFTATGTYSDGSTQDRTAAVNWASATMTVATIANTNNHHGQATTLGLGMTDISAKDGTFTAHATLTVTAAVIATIAVTPANPTIVKAHTEQFVAMATMTDGTKKDVSATATWASATMDAATVSATGLATGVAAGMSVISAASGGVTGMTTLKVTN